MLLRARCRTCHAAISPVYPVVELAVGVWFAIAASYIGRAETMEVLIADISFAVVGFLLIGLIVMDWQTHLLPDAFTLTGIAIALFLVCSQAIFLGPTEDQVLLRHKAPITAAMSVEKGNVFLTGPEALIGGRIVATLAAAGLLLLVRGAYKALRGREGMGLGDVKLLAMIAAFLGFWPAILALFLGVLTASFFAAFLLFRGRATSATRLPFGSFLAAGGLAASLFGTNIISAYISLLR
ncbi:Leader peptidase (Prepilin peptidase) [Granulicella sibirica]|uniref:Leader peptidase (Prepilin peptidase) n=2 Tax=Granulicella sibirica TaxID=2479048 RepID=A0A4Q0SYI2_9BACT|nr:Leader peptidase (Prepilin peptidase) [Granulicella sibirica]